MVKIYYQGVPGAYSHQMAEIVNNFLWWNNETIGLFSFKDIFDSLKGTDDLWVIPIENSYAWSVHQNLYLMRDYDIKIIWEYYLPVHHCLAAKRKTISEISKVYSHPQALMQCEEFLKKYNLKWIPFGDTAWAAKYISESENDEGIWCICSEYAARIYWLNIIAKNINDQKNNTTRFLIITSSKDRKLSLKEKKGTLIFRVKDQPAILFKCLWAFATRSINLTKIESIPSKKGFFEYMFWIDYILPNDIKILEDAIEELWFFTTEIKDLGKYGQLGLN